MSNQIINKQQKTRRRKILLLLLCLQLQRKINPLWPKTLEKLSYSNFGLGRGKIRNHFRQYFPKDEFSRLKEYPDLFYKMIHISVPMFEKICQETKIRFTNIKVKQFYLNILGFKL